jgi:hypothetical protein
MSASSNNHRSVASTSIFSNFREEEIMQNDLNQSKIFKRIEIIRVETTSFFDESNEDFDASKMLKSDLNVKFEQTKRLLEEREKLKKLREIKSKIRSLKRASEFVEDSRKKIVSKEIESFFNNLMQSISTSMRIIQSIVSSQIVDVTASRRRTIRFDKIFLYHDKSMKKHRDYVRNLTTTFRLISDDFSTKDFKIVYAMQSLAEESKKT